MFKLIKMIISHAKEKMFNILIAILFIFTCKYMLSILFSELGLYSSLFLLIPPISVCFFDLLSEDVRGFLGFTQVNNSSQNRFKRLLKKFIKSLFITLCLYYTLTYIWPCLTSYYYLENLDQLSVVCVLLFVVKNVMGIGWEYFIAVNFSIRNIMLWSEIKEKFTQPLVYQMENTDNDSNNKGKGRMTNEDERKLEAKARALAQAREESDLLEAQAEAQAKAKKALALLEAEEKFEAKRKSDLLEAKQNFEAKAQAKRVSVLLEKIEEKVSAVESIDSKCEKIIKENDLKLKTRGIKGDRIIIDGGKHLSVQEYKDIVKTLIEHEDKWHELAGQLNKNIERADNINKSIPFKENAKIEQEIVNPLKRKFDSLEERFSKNQTSFLSKIESEEEDNSESDNNSGPDNNS